jgi:tRNA (guanine37-N1)-methyltransferase
MVDMKFHVVTIFPGLVEPYTNESIIRRAIDAKIISVDCYNPRDYTRDKHNKVDDKPYGGGPGMVMTAEPILLAVAAIHKAIEKRVVREQKKNPKAKAKIKTILFSPGGENFTNDYAQNVIDKKYTDIIMVSGRYEGIDSRVQKILKAELLSIGDYVLTGGELPALVVLDCVTRRIPGALGSHDSLEELRTSSHEMYTRPAELVWNKKKHKVPEVLQNGNHAEIEKWRAGEMK